MGIKGVTTSASIFVNSGSSANLLTLQALKILFGRGEVIVPPLTWISDVASVIQNGFKPVFVDINQNDLNMKVEDLKLAYRRTFNTDDGEIVLSDLKARFGFETTTYSDNPYNSAFNEGQRAAVLLIVRMLTEGKEPE